MAQLVRSVINRRFTAAVEMDSPHAGGSGDVNTLVAVMIVRMSSRIRTFLLGAMLLLVPVQGTAAALADLLCDPGAQVRSVHANGVHDRDTGQVAERDKDSTGGNPLWHAFHGTFFGPGSVGLPVAATDSPSWARPPEASYDRFVAEQPYPPPLA